MEIFFNLFWVAVALTLLAAWSAAPQQPGARPLCPDVSAQLIALAVLAAVLLPVISLTDDLQTSVNPAETEHLSRRADLQISPDQQPHSQPITLALPLATPRLPSTAMLGSVIAERPVFQRARGLSRDLAIRPPPPPATTPATK